MTNDQLIQRTQDMIKERFGSESSGHDYWHMYRVWRLAKKLAASEPQADIFTIELAAWLHDIADWKFHDGDEEAGPKAAREWLESLNVDEPIITHIENIIRNVSFKGAQVKVEPPSIEGRIVHDADKLDAIGAIGIGRAFAYGGAHGHPMHDPDHQDELHTSFEAYKNSKSPTISHFYEKLLLLKGLMLTKHGKELAQQRHAFMEQFLDQFHDEWEGKR